MSVGLVFLADLHRRGPWDRDEGTAWMARRSREPKGQRDPTTAPPPAAVVVVPSHGHGLLTHSLAWLQQADAVLLVFDDSRDEGVRDPEIAALLADERAGFFNLLGNVVDVWESREPPDAAIDEALGVAADVVDGTWSSLTPLEVRPPVAPGPWIAWAHQPWRADGRADPDEVARVLAAGICLPEGRPAVFEAATGSRVDLATGKRTSLPGLEDASQPLRPVAAHPEGDRWLQTTARSGEGVGWRVGDSMALGGGHGRAIGADPGGRVLWGGGRCVYHWRVPTPAGPAFWSVSSHDWPCGHGKKLYGYADNDPLWVHLAAEGGATLSVYDHDALLTPGLPVRWVDAGGVYVLCPAQEPRSLWFQRSDAADAFPGDPSLGDEDARDRRPTITLGPSHDLRYVIGFDAPTWRLVGETGVRIDGAGWTVFSADHEAVGSGEERLVAGWHRWILVLDGDQLARIDLVGGHREALGPAGGTISDALAIPGTPNVLLVAVDDGEVRIRLV